MKILNYLSLVRTIFSAFLFCLFLETLKIERFRNYEKFLVVSLIVFASYILSTLLVKMFFKEKETTTFHLLIIALLGSVTFQTYAANY